MILQVLSKPIFWIVVHIAINVLAFVLNASKALDNKVPNAANIAHSVISILVMCLLLFFPLFYKGYKQIFREKPILFVLLILHLLVNIVYIVLLFELPKEEARRIAALSYSVASSLVCIGIPIFGK